MKMTFMPFSIVELVDYQYVLKLLSDYKLIQKSNVAKKISEIDINKEIILIKINKIINISNFNNMNKIIFDHMKLFNFVAIGFCYSFSLISNSDKDYSQKCKEIGCIVKKYLKNILIVKENVFNDVDFFRRMIKEESFLNQQDNNKLEDIKRDANLSFLKIEKAIQINYQKFINLGDNQ